MKLILDLKSKPSYKEKLESIFVCFGLFFQLEQGHLGCFHREPTIWTTSVKKNICNWSCIFLEKNKYTKICLAVAIHISSVCSCTSSLWSNEILITALNFFALCHIPSFLHLCISLVTGVVSSLCLKKKKRYLEFLARWRNIYIYFWSDLNRKELTICCHVVSHCYGSICDP